MNTVSKASGLTSQGVISKLLRPIDAARHLGVSPSLLNALRGSGNGPPFYKMSARLVVYDVDDLNTWARRDRRVSTSDDGTIMASANAGSGLSPGTHGGVK
jgi:hypothetical protein